MWNRKIAATISRPGLLLMLLFCPLLPLYVLGAEAASQEKIEVEASDTSQLKTLLVSRSVELMFRDGTYVKGQIKEVNNGEVLIKVKDSEGPSALRNGEQRVATERISTIQTTYHKGPYRAILAGGIAAGAAAPALVGIDKGTLEVPSGMALLLTAAPAGAVIGYFTGKKVDKKTMTIVIQ